MNDLKAVSPPAPVLVTGGAGYIGSHTCKALSEAGFRPIVFDDLSAGFSEAVLWSDLIVGDIRDQAAVSRAISQHGVKAIIHFAGLIEVGRSGLRPDLFYDSNVNGLASVLNAARDGGVERIVFSSSAAVYGKPATAVTGGLIHEDDATSPLSPYGDTKLAGERMLSAYCRAFGLTGVALRYFNAAGADPSGLIGEGHFPETHLIPLAIAAALGTGDPLTVFGADFDTPDGACLRDYIHVNDLARAHVAALTLPAEPHQFEAMNVGTGVGASVLEVIRAVEAELGRPAPFTIGGRRAGDPDRLVADPAAAMSRLNWRPTESSLETIVQTAAAWGRSPRYSRTAERP